MAANDGNGDGNVNLGDYLSDEHLAELLYDYDLNNDGDINACEVHDYLIASENAWRAIHCPDS
jgi:Ca2+-binding EF-hand superfamily protein